MTTWKDYAITHVREDQDGTITNVKRREVNENLGSAEVKTRQEIISSIESGNEHTTALKQPNGKWVVGEGVHILVLNGTKYIRTDKNEVEEDNLEGIPTF